MKIERSTTLQSICEQHYFPLRLTIRSDNTRYQYKLAINSFGEALGRIPTLSDLDDDAIAIWTGRLLDSGLAVDTVREKIGRVLALWAWLARRGVVRRFPTTVKPPSPDPLPQAMTEDQLRALFRSAAKERGLVAGIPADLWWTSFLAFVWTTSERKGAAMSVRLAWLDFERATVAIPPDARKGRRRWGIYRLWPQTIPLLKAVVAVQPTRELVWPWEKNEASYYTAYNRILKDGGLPVTRKTKTHGLRCSHATHLKLAGGDPTRQLTHSDPAVTQRHYLDPRLMPQDQPPLFVPWEIKDVEGG